MLLKPFLAFLIGGLICVTVQILIDKTSLTPSKILVFLVCTGVLLGSLGLYEPLFKMFGCGVSVPIIGFGGNIAKGVREAVMKDGFFGALAGSFTAAAVGCSVSLLAGFISSLLSRGKSKRL